MAGPGVVRVFSENNTFQYIDTLRRKREKRRRHREFFVEGVRPINGALAHGWTVNAFIYSRDRALSAWAEDVLARSHAATHIELPLPLLAKLSNKAEPSELLALVAMPDDRLSRIPLRDDLRVVVFDRPASPGNLGTIIRSCDALGVDGLVITGHAVDLYDPETNSATTGSLFAVPAVRLPSAEDLLPWFDLIGETVGPFQVVGTSARRDGRGRPRLHRADGPGDRQRDVGAERQVQGAVRRHGHHPDRRVGHVPECGLRRLDHPLRAGPAAPGAAVTGAPRARPRPCPAGNVPAASRVVLVRFIAPRRRSPAAGYLR